MQRKRVLWFLYPSYLLIMLLSLIAVAWYASRSLRQSYFDQTVIDLEIRARLVSQQLAANLSDSTSFETELQTLSRTSGVRLTLVSLNGNTLADSHEPTDQVGTQVQNPEFIEARAGRTGVDARYGKSLDEPILFVAVPIRENQTVQAVVRAALPIGFIEDALADFRLKIGIGALVIGLFAAGISLAISRRISRPIQDMRAQAARYAAGDFSSRMPVQDTEEIGGLAEAMNTMAGQLDDRIRTITRQRNEQDVILASMVEGVIAVDTDERLMILNHAAAQLLDVNPDEVRGRSIQEVVRNTDLQRLFRQTLTSRDTAEGEIILAEKGEQVLKAHGSIMRDTAGQAVGALVVFHDITQLRKLEHVRRDFVANVSHELKTPITSIKGFVETLQDGAIDSAEDTARFLGIIARQVDRLNSIIEDLLMLSRIEQEAEKAEIQLDMGNVCEVLTAGINSCQVKAKEKQMEIKLLCDPRLIARMNQPLLEQAVVNLIDNAIKYSDPAKPITVCGTRTETEVVIEIRDEGRGIAKEHHARLFERFYRVDRARSRSMGGTGLGLAIVKPIVLAHGGHASVESEPGAGSIFRIHLPASKF